MAGAPRPALCPSLTRPAQGRWRGRARAGRGLGRRAPELVASMRPLCPWREAEVAEFRPEAPGRRDGEDVGFVSPGHCPGCEQEEAAAHSGRPHPGEWPGRSVGRVTLVHLRPLEEVTAAGLWARSAAAASPPCPPRPGWRDKQARAGLLHGSVATPELRFPAGRAPPHAEVGGRRVCASPRPAGAARREPRGATVRASRAFQSSAPGTPGSLGEGTATPALEVRREGGSSPRDLRASAASDVRAQLQQSPPLAEIKAAAHKGFLPGVGEGRLFETPCVPPAGLRRGRLSQRTKKDKNLHPG